MKSFFETDLSPVDKTAAIVVGKGVHYDPNMVHQFEHYINPPATLQFTGPKDQDMAGRKYGFMSVVGYLGKRGRGALWLVKCKCGMYEVRRSKSIKKASPRDKCQACHHLDHIKNHYKYLQSLSI